MPAPKRAAALRRRAVAAKATARKPARRVAKPTRPAAKKAKPARKAAAKSTPKQAPRAIKRAPIKAVKKSPPKTAKKTAQRVVVRKAAAPKRAAKPTAIKKAAPPQKAAAKPKMTLLPPARIASPKPIRAAQGNTGKKKQALGLDRERRVMPDEDDVVLWTPPSSLNLDRTASSARTGRQELKERYEKHNETSPALTAGDVDADWESAYSVGDEAPGGDNPTPDQNVVDDIGIAVGNEYRDNEELEGADKIEERDKHRWELDPESSDDFDER